MADVSKHVEKAERLLLKGKHHDALKELLRASEEDPQNDAIRLQTADLSASLQRNQEAVRLYVQVFERQASVGDVAAATLTYKKMAHLEQPAVAHMLRYAALVERTSREEAIAAYRAAVQQLARSPEQAIAVQSRIVALAPSARDFELLADLEIRTGNFTTAAESLLKAAQQAERASDNEALYGYLYRAHETDPGNRTAALKFSGVLIERQLFGEAATVLQPLASAGDPEAAGLYGRVLLQCDRPEEAEPYVWRLYERDRSAIPLVGQLMGKHLAAGNPDAALALAHRLEVRESGHRRRRDFILMMKDIVMRHEPHVEVLSYLAELLNSANREHDYCDVLGRLFDIHFACGQFEKAADALDRAGEVDPYDPANQRRLASLQGKIDERRYRTVATRFGKAAPVRPETETEAPTAAHPTVLEDLMLQAELFLQYGMNARAVERLQRIQRLFPSEEINNGRLQQLYQRASFVSPESAAAEPAGAATAAAPQRAPIAPRHAPPTQPPSAGIEDELIRIAEVSHNIFRHVQVEALLFAAANDIGRLLGTARCIVALCSPGAPPAAFAEHCAPKIQRSGIEELVNLVIAAGTEVKNQTPAFLADSAQAYNAVQEASASAQLGSLAIAPLMLRDEFTGVLIAGHQNARPWTKYESSAITMLADHVALAANTAKLRKTLEAVAPRELRTGLLKRSAYFDALTFEIARGIQHRTPLSLVLLRVASRDGGKDELTPETARCLLPYVRQTDVGVRYDANTIALILGNTTEKAAKQAVTKLRRIVRHEKATKEAELTAGIAQALMSAGFDPADIATEVANRAASALGEAMQEGEGATKTIPQPPS